MPIAVAVIGAGMSGLACARALHDAGATVTVFERSPAVGGRLTTRRSEVGTFDHGAQYFTAANADFQECARAWVASGHAAVWEGSIGKLAHGQFSASSGATERFVGVPTMDAVAREMAIGLSVRFEQTISRLEAIGVGRSTRWTLKRLADPLDADGIEVTEGLYDVVVVAAPPRMGGQLLSASAPLGTAIGALRFQPCFSLAMAFADPLPLSFDGAFVDGPRLSWVARDSSKPGRRSGERGIAHATPQWSVEHLEDDLEDVKAKLVKAFQDASGVHSQPVYVDLKRWRAASPEGDVSEPCLFDARLHLGACGDWCTGGRVEGAWESGNAMAKRVLASPTV